MIHHRWEPGDKATGMAGITLGNSRYMVGGFTQRIDPRISPAVAGRTLTSHSRMAHPRRFKGRKIGVAGIALRAGRNMVGWLAQRSGAMAI